MKRPARLIIEKHYTRLTLDFQTNKRVCDDVAVIPTKRLRNKIAGYVTHMMKRIQKGSVSGISLKLQEEERERRMDVIPEVSAIDTDVIKIDSDTRDMLKALELTNIPGLVVENYSHPYRRRSPHSKPTGRKLNAQVAARPGPHQAPKSHDLGNAYYENEELINQLAQRRSNDARHRRKK